MPSQNFTEKAHKGKHILLNNYLYHFWSKPGATLVADKIVHSVMGRSTDGSDSKKREVSELVPRYQNFRVTYPAGTTVEFEYGGDAVYPTDTTVEFDRSERMIKIVVESDGSITLHAADVEAILDHVRTAISNISDRDLAAANAYFATH